MNVKTLFNSQSLAALSYYGGKSSMRDFVLPKFPWHHTYIEVFGGSGALLCAKPPSQIEIYNDRHPGMAHFISVVKDVEGCDELYRRLRLTANSRREHEACSENYPASDPVEWARQVFVLIRQSFSSIFDHTWAYRREGRSNEFANSVELLPSVSQRLRNVIVENVHFSDMFAKYDGERALWYLDPPYLKETRVSPTVYPHEMVQSEHELLLSQIVRLKGAVVLSGYPSSVYDDALPGWKIVTKSVPCTSSPNACKPKRIESLWLNPVAVERQIRRCRPQPSVSAAA